MVRYPVLATLPHLGTGSWLNHASLLFNSSSCSDLELVVINSALLPLFTRLTLDRLLVFDFRLGFWTAFDDFYFYCDSSGHRNCLLFRKRISDKRLDRRTVCISCRSIKCDLQHRCEECQEWTDVEMTDYLKHRKSIDSKSKERKKKTKTSH